MASSLAHSPIARFFQSDYGPLTLALFTLICITANDFMFALKEVQPSAQREGFVTILNIVTPHPSRVVHGCRTANLPT